MSKGTIVTDERKVFTCADALAGRADLLAPNFNSATTNIETAISLSLDTTRGSTSEWPLK
jgi:hypothetical protein